MTSFADPGTGGGGNDSRNVQVNLDADVSGYSQAMSMAQRQTDGVASSVGKLTGSIHGLAQYAGKQLIHFAVADFAGLSAGVADAASLEHQLGTLRATSVVTGTSMGDMKKQMDSAFTSFPVARSQVIQLAETINSLGVTAPKAVGSMIGTFTKLGAATGEDPNGLASSSIQLDRQLGHTDPAAVADYANSLLTVSKNQGVAASGVLDFAANIAPMARAAGIGEAAVLGISAAFQKAGADGAYAANAFNQITGDITNLSQTGSPAIAKYSTFVGKTADQFRSESGTEQVTSVFNQIAKGGSQANAFVSSLGLGQRAVTSIQAVAQSGGLNEAVAQAQGSATNTNNLDSASKTALAGLSNSAVDVGNQFTRLGEMIGDPLLKPITALVNVFDAGLGLMNKVVSAMGPIPGYVAAVVGALAIPAGLALGHVGLVGSLALGRTLLGPSSSVRTAARDGKIAGQAIKGGATPESAMLLTPTGRRIAAGLDPEDEARPANLRLTGPYNMASNRAARAGQPGLFENQFGMSPMAMASQKASQVSGKAKKVAAATEARIAEARSKVGTQTPQGAWIMGAAEKDVQPSTPSGTTLFMRNAAQKARAAAADPLGAARRTAAAAPRVAMGSFTYLTDQQRKIADDSRLTNPLLRSGNLPVPPEERFGYALRNGSPGRTYRAVGNLVNSTTRAAGSMVASTVGSVVRLGEPGVIRSGVAAAGGVAARAGGAAFGALSKGAGLAFGTPLGLLATTIGVPLISSIVSGIKNANAARSDVTQSVGSAAGYDQALDKTSTNLAKFATSVDTAAAALAKLSTFSGAPLKSIAKVTDADIAAVNTPGFADADASKGGQLKTVINKARDATAAKGGDPDAVYKAGLSYVESQASQETTVTGDMATKYKQDLINEIGKNPQSQAIVTKIMSQFATDYTQPGGLNGGKGNPFNQMAVVAGQADRNGGELNDFKNAFGTGVAGLGGATQNSGTAGQKAMFANMINMGATATGPATTGQTEDITSVGDYLQQYLGIDSKQFDSQIWKAARKAGTYKAQYNQDGGLAGFNEYSSSKEAIPVISQAISQTDRGKSLMQQYGLKTPEDLAKLAENPGALPPPSANEQVSTLAQYGPLGIAASKNSLLQAVTTGNQTGQAGPAFTAQQQVIASAAKLASGNFADTEVSIRKLSDSMGGVSQPTGALIKAAADWQSQLEQFKLPQMTQESQLSTLSNDASTAVAALNPHSTTETVQAAQAKVVAAKNEQNQYQASMVSRITQINDFGTQQARALTAQNLQVANTNRDFDEQQKNAAFDFGQSQTRSIADFAEQQRRAVEDQGTQKLRAQEDYQTQSQRSTADFQLQNSRQNADHARDLARQAEASAQTIYNPFVREQRKATTDAGTLVYNLNEQNSDIEKQVKQLADLKKRGLSQQAIDTLNLSGSDSAQQVDTLDQSLAQNPNLTKQLNAQIGTRVADTTKLTQNPANMQFRQSEADYKQGQQRASTDFTKSMSRAASDYEKTTARQDADFAKQQLRAQSDQHKTMERATEDNTKATARAVFDHDKALSDMAKAFKLTQDNAAADLATSFKQYAGGFDQIYAQLATSVTGNLSKIAPAATKILQAELTQIKNDNPWIAGSPANPAFVSGQDSDKAGAVAANNPGVAGWQAVGLAATNNANIANIFAGPAAAAAATPAGATGWLGRAVATNNANTAATPTPVGPATNVQQAYAFGGISLTQQIARVSENGPELHLPLNSTGQDFMTGLITKSLAQVITHAQAVHGSSSSVSNDNSISFAGADIKVVAQDPNGIAKALAAKAKLARLASPVRH